MKLKPVLLLTLVFILFSLQNQAKNVTIHGIVIGNTTNTPIRYSVPIHGVCYPGFDKSVEVDSAGSFTIILTDVDKPALVWISIWGKASGYLITDPGKTYEVEFRLDDSESFLVKGEGTKAQQIVNDFNYLTPKASALISKYCPSDQSPEKIRDRIFEDKEKELRPLTELIAEGEISKELFEAVKTDRDCYYDMIWEVIATKLFNKAAKSGDSSLIQETKELLVESFKNPGIENGDNLRAVFYKDQLDAFIDFKINQRYDFNDESYMADLIKTYGSAASFHVFKISEAKKFLQGEVLEYYFASYLFSAAFQKKFEPELITLFEEFTKSFPNSRYTEYIDPLILSIKEFHQTKLSDNSEKVHFVKNYQKLDYLNDVIKTFTGKALYIDVWATWCGPCKEEFGNNEKLRALLDSRDVEIVYISIDKENKEETWKDMIKYYNLEGNHIRTNAILLQDLTEIFNQKGLLSIPWYILVNKKGVIVNKNAPRPSELKALETEIGKM